MTLQHGSPKAKAAGTTANMRGNRGLIWTILVNGSRPTLLYLITDIYTQLSTTQMYQLHVENAWFKGEPFYLIAALSHEHIITNCMVSIACPSIILKIKTLIRNLL